MLATGLGPRHFLFCSLGCMFSDLSFCKISAKLWREYTFSVSLRGSISQINRLCLFSESLRIPNLRRAHSNARLRTFWHSKQGIALCLARNRILPTIGDDLFVAALSMPHPVQPVQQLLTVPTERELHQAPMCEKMLTISQPDDIRFVVCPA